MYPFLVECNGISGNVRVYKQRKDIEITPRMEMAHLRSNYEKNFVLQFNAKKIYVGKSPKNNTTIDTGYGEYYDGNSMLLHLYKKKYVFIGSNIYTFEAIHTINYFISPISGNVVPMPYATDELNNIYLFAHYTILKNSTKSIKYKQCKADEDPYCDFWSKDRVVVKDCEFHEFICPIYKKNYNNRKIFIDNKMITGIFVNNNEITLFYGDPNKSYDRYTKNDSKMYITLGDSKEKIELTKEKYVEIMTQFAEKNKLAYFNESNILIERFG